MSSHQILPTYTHKFLEFPWRTHESENYVFHFSPGSTAEKEIGQIVLKQESARTKILDFLKPWTPQVKKIEYFLYETFEDKKQLMGDDWYAIAVLDENRIHAMYNVADRVVGPHEDTHILSRELGEPFNFLSEGLAEFMVGHSWRGESFLEVVAAQNPNNAEVRFSNFLTKESWLATPDHLAQFYYALAALFVDFFIERYSKESFFTIYKECSVANTHSQNKEVVERVVGRAIEEIDSEWLEWLRMRTAA